MINLASLAVRLGLDNSDLQKGLQQSEGMVNKFGSSIGGLLGKTAVAGFAAAATGAIALGAALKNGVDEAMAWEEGTAQLTARLKSTGGAAGVTEKQVLDLASSIQSSTKFSDDMVLSASNLMLTFTKVGRDVFPEAIRAATNMSTAMGQDLQSSVIQLGKALNDPVEGISALSRVGVQLTEDQKELIKNLVETNRVAEAQGIILKELETQMGGAAEAAGNTFNGQMVIIKNQLLDLTQTFGTALLPVMKDVASGLRTAFADPAIQASIQGLATDIASMARGGVSSIQSLVQELGTIKSAVDQNRDTFTNLGIVLGATILAPKVGAGLLAITTGLQGITTAIAGGGGLAAAMASLGTAIPVLVIIAALAAIGIAIKQTMDEVNRQVKAQEDKQRILAGGLPGAQSDAIADSVAKAKGDVTLQGNLTSSWGPTGGKAYAVVTAAQAAAAKAADTAAAALSGLGTVSSKVGVSFASLVASSDEAVRELESQIQEGIQYIARNPNDYAAVLKLKELQDDWRRTQGIATGATSGAGLGATPSANAALSFQQLLAKAFPSVGAAQGWMGAYSSQHGGAQATATDLRDKLAGDLFAQKYGRAATEEEWQQRYYKGFFEGVEEGGLDATFGKPGTWATLISEKAKQEASETQKLIDAFKAETDKVLMVQLVGKRITD